MRGDHLDQLVCLSSQSTLDDWPNNSRFYDPALAVSGAARTRLSNWGRH